ncbi:MAG: hypothetical protein ACJAYU_004232 [Bradymonadia bacterium]|jgi:hypothetical protein
MTDRRTSPRHTIDILLNAFHNGLPTLCLGQDVSEAGICLRALQDVSATVASALDLEFQLPGRSHVISARGNIRRRASGQLGVFFEKISEADRAVIRAYVAA